MKPRREKCPEGRKEASFNQVDGPAYANVQIKSLQGRLDHDAVALQTQ